MEQSRKEKLDDIKHEITILKDDIKSIKNDMKELKKILLCRNAVSEVKLTDKWLVLVLVTINTELNSNSVKFYLSM